MLSSQVLGLADVLSTLTKLPKQAQYAGMLAINETAKTVQKREFEESNKVFTIRKNWNKPRTKFGFNIQFAKRDNLLAKVYSIAPWLENQEFGGIKNKDYNKYSPIMVPAKAIQQTKGRLVPKKLSLNALKTNPVPSKAFQIKGNWFRRNGKNLIEPLFFKEQSVPIKARFHFTAIGTKIIEGEYQAQYSKAFKYSLSKSL